jgi:DNA repair protein RecO (recombination protein O)
MLKKTKGIALNYIKYKESSIIVKIFTRELGLKSYIVNGVRSQGKGSKIAHFQPLTLLDLVVYEKENSGLQQISETKIFQSPLLLPFDLSRTSIALFMTELISRSIYEGYQNEELFDFIEDSVLHLDNKEIRLTHFPLVFLLGNAKYLGFAPETADGFLIESSQQPFSKEEIVKILDYVEDLVKNQFLSNFNISGNLRRKLLDHLLDFHSEQLDQTTPLKSLAVIRQVMD